LKNAAEFYDKVAPQRAAWMARGRYYHSDLQRLMRFLVPKGKRIVEIGCGIGDTLASIDAVAKCGVDVSPEMIKCAAVRHPEIEFVQDDIETLKLDRKFDYVIMSNLIGVLDDVQPAFGNARQLMEERSRLIVTYYNRLWQPFLNLAERLGLKMPEPQQNWLALEDVENLLELNGFEVLRRGIRMLLPLNVPFVSWFLNRVVAHLPGFRHLCLTTYVVARLRPAETTRRDCSVSIIVPTKNEAGNIFGAVERTPEFGAHMEFIYIDGNSTDGTPDKVKDLQAAYPDKDIKFMTQTGTGKANAVWEAMDVAEGELLMILDSDLTVPPEELPRFYEVYVRGYAEYVNGVRLVYAREKEAMRFLNSIANHMFAVIFTWVLGYRIKDTLCGTKVLSKADYRDLRANMAYFGDFDPFGDFQIIFGATKLNLKVADVPVHYKARTYGDIEIHRWRDGLLLLRMVGFALLRLKFV
jgi:SAM-dependent methyltransferase